jgi:transcriptional regulator with PAS, ATPase and Fis domain
MKDPGQVGLGPIKQAVEDRPWNEVILLCDYPQKQGDYFQKWLRRTSKTPEISLHKKTLSSPTNFSDIYRAADEIIKNKQEEFTKPVNFTFHLSPGTPAMAAVWIILSKTKFPATLIESSREHGVKTVSIPFDISADFIPDQIHTPDDKIVQLAAGLSRKSPAFKDIIHRSEIMQRVVVKSRLAAVRTIPVLIEGESGTGKELLAKAIHAESSRADKPFIAINCGAIPEELIESELFGHEKGAFTGAGAKRQGHFEAADSGTLFLDEIGELPVRMQVKLLRVLQEGEVKPVGATKVNKVDVRIIAATNKNLIWETATGDFREDLLYRMKVATITIPPLRLRRDDIIPLAEHFMAMASKEHGRNISKVDKKYYEYLEQYDWPGNVRELRNVVEVSVILARGSDLSMEDIHINESVNTGKSKFVVPPDMSYEDLDKEILMQVLSRYKGNRTIAADKLGISRRTIQRKIKEYELPF